VFSLEEGQDKGFIIWEKNNKQDTAILPSRVANHSAGFGSFFPLVELII